MIRCIIKGTVYEAREALDKRGIGTTGFLIDLNGTVDAIVHDLDLEAVTTWFCEQIPAIKGQGFPPGSLLLYTLHTPKEGWSWRSKE